MDRRIDIRNRRRLWSFPFRLALFASLVSIAGLLEVATATYIYFSRDLPAIPPFSQIRFGTVSTIRATHGQVLGEVFEERRYLLPRERIPDIVVKAFIASEDERFFEHSGLDLLGIIRAIVSNLRAGQVREGASTITQQLARSLLLNPQKTLSRKIREAILARRIEDIYTKDQILLLYLNLIFLGEGYYGVQAAARGYFGKDVSQLSLAEAATIAGLPSAPSRLNPRENEVAARARRDRVLRRMVEAGFITPEEQAKASKDPIRILPRRDNFGDRAPLVAAEVIEFLRPKAKDYEEGNPLLTSGGLQAETTVDLGLQLLADRIVWDGATYMTNRQGFRGPIARLPHEEWQKFLQRNGTWLREHEGEGAPRSAPILAVVLEVSRDGALIGITPDLRGWLPIEGMRWAAPYTEFPLQDATSGQRKEVQTVSLDGRIKDCSQVLRPGDVILVRPLREQQKNPPQTELPLYELTQFPGPQAALAVADVRTGALLAVAGGADFDLSQVDRTRSYRQTGSIIKPIYYSKAYDIGIPPSTVVSGAPFRAGSWTPTGEKAAEDMTIFEALTKSENTISLRVFQMVLDRVGVEGLNDWAKRLGLSRPFQGFFAEALGVDATPREVLQAFSVFANNGLRQDLHLIKVVRDGDGKVIEDRRSPRDPTVPIVAAILREVASGPEISQRAITPEVAYIISENLRRVAERGTAAKARRLGRPVYGKTGTLPFDVWFAGFTEGLSAVAWVGQDMRERFLGRSRAKSRVFGADTALPMWLNFMEEALKGRPPGPQEQKPPPGVVVVQVDGSTGLLAREDGIPMPHLRGTEPTEYAPLPGERPLQEVLSEF